MEKMAESQLERSLWLKSRCDGLLAGILALPGISNEQKRALAELVRKVENQAYVERLKKIEETNPDLAGRINRVVKHPDTLSDDTSILEFP